MTSKLARTTQRSFSWGIKSTDISFMRPQGRPDIPLEGTNDCGCGSVTPAPQKKRAARAKTSLR
jgi:hypothetical protein